MSLTQFPNGVSSFGALPEGGFMRSNNKSHWWVDSDAQFAGDGSDPDHPFSTMAQCFAILGSGDTIHVLGNVREQLVTPAGIFDVLVIGEGNRPRHADAHTDNNGYTAANWRAPASGAVVGQANVRVIQQGWRFVNILFVAGDSTAAMIEIVRNAASGDSERDGSHCSVYGCRFAGAGVGIRFGAASFTEIPYNCEIAYNKFNDCTYAIRGAILTNSASIHHNEFQACTNVIILTAMNTFIYENIVGSFTAAANSGGIDLAGGGGLNMITKNYLSGTYSNAGGYVRSNANDEWAGNFNTLAGGITVADPA